MIMDMIEILLIMMSWPLANLILAFLLIPPSWHGDKAKQAYWMSAFMTPFFAIPFVYFLWKC